MYVRFWHVIVIFLFIDACISVCIGFLFTETGWVGMIVSFFLIIAAPFLLVGFSQAIASEAASKGSELDALELEMKREREEVALIIDKLEAHEITEESLLDLSDRMRSLVKDAIWIREQRREDDFLSMPARVARCLLPAKPEDYQAWVKGYLASGGSFTHHYDYPMPRKFVVVTRDCFLPPLCGSRSVAVLVPAGIILDLKDGLGHNTIYFMQDFSFMGSWVPSYANVK